MKRPRTALPTAGVVVVALTTVFLASSQGHLDTTPPTLRVDPPPGPVSGRIGLAVSVYDDQPGVREIWAEVGPLRVELPLAGGTLTVDTTRLPDGPQELRVVARDRSWSRNQAEQRVRLEVRNGPPPPPPPAADPAPAPAEVSAPAGR